MAIAEAAHAARDEHNPQTSIASRQQPPDPRSREIFTGSWLKTREPNTVERKQAGRRSKPQISVVGLRDGSDIKRSAVLFRPCGMDELRDGLLGVEREGSRGKEPHRKPNDDEPSKAPCARLSCSRNVSFNQSEFQSRVGAIADSWRALNKWFDSPRNFGFSIPEATAAGPEYGASCKNGVPRDEVVIFNS